MMESNKVIDLIIKNTKIKSLDEFNELSRKNPRKALKQCSRVLKKIVLEKVLLKG